MDLTTLTAIVAAALISAQPAKVIVVTATEGYRHESIETAEEVIASIGRQTGWFSPQFVRTEAEIAVALHADALASARIVMFVNTTGDLEWPDRQRLLDWILAGGSFIGVHSAADTWHGWPGYLEMLGGEFREHPPEAYVEVFADDPSHPSTTDLEFPLRVFEEIYFFDRFSRERVHMILSLRNAPDDGRSGFFPIAWHRRYGRGLVFYTALGHRTDIWQSDWFAKHLRGAIDVALRTVGRRRAVRP